MFQNFPLYGPSPVIECTHHYLFASVSAVFLTANNETVAFDVTPVMVNSVVIDLSKHANHLLIMKQDCLTRLSTKETALKIDNPVRCKTYVI